MVWTRRDDFIPGHASLHLVYEREFEDFETARHFGCTVVVHGLPYDGQQDDLVVNLTPLE